MGSIAHGSGTTYRCMMRLTEHFLSEAAGDRLLVWLLGSDRVCWTQEELHLFGRRVPVPRLVAWFGSAGVNYRYAGEDHLCSGWPPPLQRLRDRLSGHLHRDFNLVLLNRYDHGGQYMGWHKDDEPQSGSCIASVSLGAARRFRIRHPSQSHTTDLTLGHGSLLVFDGRQRHTLPRTARDVARRVNLTFRVISV